MAFNSIIFIGWFLPFLLAIYYLSPYNCRNIVLLIFNCIFLIYGSITNPICLLVTIGVLVCNYFLGILIGLSRKHALFPDLLLVIGVLANLGLLFAYKFLNLTNDVIMPAGISFYIFQSVSYLADIKRNATKPEHSPMHYLNYMLLFSQFVAGPIVRHEELQEELRKRVFNKEDFFSGIEEFVLGLSIKAILADQLSGLWVKVEAIGYESLSTPFSWLGIVAFSLQLYLDFAGYSMMAIGLGKMFGFHLPTNFDYPYQATSMTEFWRKWHMTLGSWFRDYIYIPLGGNRRGHFRTFINLFAVWLFTALWHGIEINFLCWGLFLFIIILIEKSGLKKFMDRFKVIGHLYMIILIPLSWMLFAVRGLDGVWTYTLRLFGQGGVNVFAGDFTKYMSQYWPFLLAGLLCSTKGPRLLYKHLPKVLKPIILIALFIGSVYMVYLGENNPFMYFSF